MSQFLSQQFRQQMRMDQRLTPQLIQSMSILQKPISDLEAYIEEALESNAALELAEPEAVEPSPGSPDAARNGDDRTNDGQADPEAGSFGRFDRFSRDYDLDIQDRGPSRVRPVVSSDGRDAKLGAMANTAGREIGLHETLLGQWSLVELEEPIRRAGEAIINHLDPDGYLRVRLELIAESVRPPIPLEELQTALVEVQKLEPPGIGARDTEECLLLQLDTLPGDNHLERVLIKNHLHDIAHNRLPAVAKATGFGLGEINEAMKAMRSMLCLHPGYLVGDRSVPTIRPDVIVDYADSGGGLTVRLARGNMPKLAIRKEVAALSKSRENGKETRDFARKHVEEATALIDAVKFRQSRLLEVARALVEKQRDFFDVGPQGLKILRMSDLAVELECDPSTISRTVAEKYMQTPRGMYPLRYFFTGGTETEDGQSMGWDRVKVRVRELVEAEDGTKPLNDERIAALLKNEGIEISRRTVAKYRQQLDIPAARQRRKY
ncbi:MAG: RNA polymerase factor sigma-54 [Phycisphaerae bacterium]